MMRDFYASVFWRAAVSPGKANNNIRFSGSVMGSIKAGLLQPRLSSDPTCSIRVWNLTDPTCEGGFSNEALAEFLFPPARYKQMDRAAPGHEGAFAVFGGLFVEFYSPALPVVVERQAGFLTPSKRRLIAPKVNIFDIPPMVQVMVAAKRKNLIGNQTFQD
jgi:hypothetical protein